MEGESAMSFLKQNEISTNSLAIKLLWGVFVGGFGMLLFSKFTGMAVTSLNTILTVSYTHLDVYKRQKNIYIKKR